MDVLKLALAAAVALLFSARPALAYVDPGTGGAFFGSIAPVLGILVVFFLGTLRFTWRYIKDGAGFVARHWLIALAAVAAAGGTAAVLLGLLPR